MRSCARRRAGSARRCPTARSDSAGRLSVAEARASAAVRVSTRSPLESPESHSTGRALNRVRAWTEIGSTAAHHLTRPGLGPVCARGKGLSRIGRGGANGSSRASQSWLRSSERSPLRSTARAPTSSSHAISIAFSRKGLAARRTSTPPTVCASLRSARRWCIPLCRSLGSTPSFSRRRSRSRIDVSSMREGPIGSACCARPWPTSHPQASRKEARRSRSSSCATSTSATSGRSGASSRKAAWPTSLPTGGPRTMCSTRTSTRSSTGSRHTASRPQPKRISRRRRSA